MKYEMMYEKFKEIVPECLDFCETEEAEQGFDEDDGMHPIFGGIVVPYIESVRDDDRLLDRIFDFLTSMLSETDDIVEVVEQSVLEQLMDIDQQFYLDKLPDKLRERCENIIFVE